MKITELIDILSATPVNVDENTQITGGYAGDVLSFVMGKAPSGSAWFTVMSNVNVAAVALLAEVGVVVLCENAKAEDALRERVIKEKINLIETKLDIFSAIKAYVNYEN